MPCRHIKGKNLRCRPLSNGLTCVPSGSPGAPSAVCRHTACAWRRVAERKCGGYRYRNVAPSAAAASTASFIPVLTVLSVISQIRRLLGSAGAFITALQRNFQGGHHHLQLADVVVIGKAERYDEAGYRPEQRPAVLAAFSARCLSVVSCTNG